MQRNRQRDAELAIATVDEHHARGRANDGAHHVHDRQNGDGGHPCGSAPTPYRPFHAVPDPFDPGRLCHPDVGRLCHHDVGHRGASRSGGRHRVSGVGAMEIAGVASVTESVAERGSATANDRDHTHYCNEEGAGR